LFNNLFNRLQEDLLLKGKRKKKWRGTVGEGCGVVILLCQMYIWYILNKLPPHPSSCYSAHTKCSLKPCP